MCKIGWDCARCGFLHDISSSNLLVVMVGVGFGVGGDGWCWVWGGAASLLHVVGVTPDNLTNPNRP